MIPNLRTPIIYILAVACIAFAGMAAIERTMAAKAKEKLALEKLDRKTEENERNRAALRHAETQIQNLATHTTRQTEISNALQETTHKLATATARNRDLTGRVQHAADQLAAAADRHERAADGPPAGDQGHRPDPLVGLLAEGGQLLAEAGRVVAEGVEVVGRRDSEVRALIDVVENDRALGAAGDMPASSTIALIPATGAKLPSPAREDTRSKDENR